MPCIYWDDIFKTLRSLKNGKIDEIDALTNIKKNLTQQIMGCKKPKKKKK